MTQIKMALLGVGCMLGLLACADAEVDVTRHALTVVCAAPADIAADAWMCSESRTLRCDEVVTTVLYVPERDHLACEQHAIDLLSSGPFAPGTHDVTVQSANGERCTSELTVIDETAPVLLVHTNQLWPPNHTLITIDVDDCVTAIDDCDGSLRGEFIWASSDEPIDDVGDGHYWPDIALTNDCQQISLRAERQGTENGRVYTLGVRFMDAAGNRAEAQCQVTIDHDQGDHPAIDSGEAYRLTFDGTNNTRECGMR